jgi:hypothetical protein
MTNEAFGFVGHWLFKAFPVRSRVIHWVPLHRRGVAQLAEHWFPKPAVAGSSPSAPALNWKKNQINRPLARPFEGMQLAWTETIALT